MCPGDRYGRGRQCIHASSCATLSANMGLKRTINSYTSRVETTPLLFQLLSNGRPTAAEEREDATRLAKGYWLSSPVLEGSGLLPILRDGSIASFSSALLCLSIISISRSFWKKQGKVCEVYKSLFFIACTFREPKVYFPSSQVFILESSPPSLLPRLRHAHVY